MATGSIDAPTNVRKVQESWGTEYYASADALIRCGLLTDAQIPGRPGCPRSRVFRFERDGRQWTVSTRPSSGEVRVQVGLTDDELEAWRAKNEAERAFRNVNEEEQKNLDALPHDRNHYFEYVRVMAGIGITESTRDFLTQPFGGYALRPDALDEFLSSVAEAFRDLCVPENVTFSRSARDAYIRGARQRIAQADPTFRSFIESTTQTANG